MSIPSFDDLLLHVGHNIEVVTYGDPPENVSIECTDCYEVLIDFSKHSMSNDKIIKVKNIRQTSHFCPSQWEGRTENNEYLYVRYRFGCLSVEIDGKLLYSRELNDGLDGIIELEEVISVLKKESIILDMQKQKGREKHEKRRCCKSSKDLL